MLVLSQPLFLILLEAFAVGAIGSLVLYKNARWANWWSNFWALTGSAAGIGAAAEILLSGEIFTVNITPVASLFPIDIRLDGLAAFFLLIISVISFFSTLYAVGYMSQFYKKYNLGVFGFFYNIFIASMMLVVTANHALYFLLAWEIMSLASYFLVIFENDHEENIQAGFLYLVMTHLATGAILLAFLLLYGRSGSFDFTAIRVYAGSLPPSTIAVVSLLMLAGFGTKAGIIPFHIWLPKAHPAAPSHVSALMSGVMIKTGIFMIIKVFFDIIPITPLWLGLLILVIGAVSSLLGVLYALSEHDLKRLLAYHSVENIGIILMGVGSSLAFMELGFKTLAVLGLVAALYHTMNHAVFKALLFLGAGSVVTATHTRNIEEYGGLIKRMPYTALFFLVGAVAISALPPFNGFASEWLTFQALFTGAGQFDILTRSVFIFAVVSLAFTGGLAAACFVKAFGVSFLAKPRSEESEKAKETSIVLQAGMGVLAVLCLILGVSASFIIPRLGVIAGSLGVFTGTRPAFAAAGNGVGVRDGFAVLSLFPIFIALVAASAAAFLIFNRVSRRQKEKVYGTWDCGAVLTPRMEITATSFSRSLISIFSGILKPTKQVETEYNDANIRYFTKSSTVILGLSNLYKNYFYDPVYNGAILIADRVKQIQGGNINVYLLYIFITIIGLLIWIIL